MDDILKRIVSAHLTEESNKEAQDDRTPSNYTIPYNQLMENMPYYQEQEVSDTHLQLNSPSNNPDGYKPQMDKMLVYPEQDWTNVDWGGENFTSPYTNEIQQEFNRTDNDPKNLYDPMKGASEISDLTSRTASAVDLFLSSNNFVRIANFDLDNFLKVSEDTLIHKSNKDLWKMVQDKDGNIYISRLVDDGVIQDT